MKKKILAVSCALLAAVSLSAVLAGCGGEEESASTADLSSAELKDGTYEGKSSVSEGDEEGNGDGYGVVTLTIRDGKIADCEYLTYTTDGELKDEEYGKINGTTANKAYYNKAQKAVAAASEYATQLAASGDLSSVDAISGATINYDHFVEAVNTALAEAAAE